MIGKVLAVQFGYNQYVIRTNLEGISHEDSLIQPQKQGNCINWVVGHIVATRNGLLRLLGESPVWPEEEARLYQRGSQPVRPGSPALPLERILNDLHQSQERITGALTGLTHEDLSRKAEGSDESVAEQVATLSFHESYHAGQVGLLRRIIGRAGKIQ